MAAINVKLVHGISGCPASQRLTVQGLGLKKMNSCKLLPDTPATMGMIEKVKHLVEWERVDKAPPIGRAAKKNAKQKEA